MSPSRRRPDRDRIPSRSRLRNDNGGSFGDNVRRCLVEHRQGAHGPPQRNGHNHSWLSCSRSNHSRPGGQWSYARRWSSATASEHKNQAEAEYRYVLTRLRENGESIALLQGGQDERNGIDRSFRTVLHAWHICIQTVRTTIVSQGSGYIAGVLPIILCAAKFLDGAMTLGEVMQAASAFTIVLGAFNWLVDNYPRLAEWAASTRRVASLQISLDELDRAEVQRISRIYSKANGPALRSHQLSVTLDDRSLITAPLSPSCRGRRGARAIRRRHRARSAMA